MTFTDTDARVRLPMRTLMDRRGIVAMASQQTLTALINADASCAETLAGSRTRESHHLCHGMRSNKK